MDSSRTNQNFGKESIPTLSSATPAGGFVTRTASTEKATVGTSESGNASSDRSSPERVSLSKLPRKRSSLPKQDRSQLRKGKWTLEEEEYTSRIIHYFSTGLLTLPEGTTLRSYVAEKLNCDPMRITKKYAGAACLGRRAYHFREQQRAQPTNIAEIQVARAQLDELEHRFRMRVEEGHNGGNGNNSVVRPLLTVPSPSHNIVPVPPATAPGQPPAPQFPAWLLGLASTAARSPWPSQGAAAAPGLAPTPVATAPASNWLLPSLTAPMLPGMAGLSNFATIPGLPAPHVGATAPGSSMSTSSPVTPPHSNTPPPPIAGLTQAQQEQVTHYAEQLRKAYELQLAAVQGTTAVTTAPVPVVQIPAAASKLPPSTHNTTKEMTPTEHNNTNKNASQPGSGVNKKATKPRTEEDRAAGTILMGFLSSLRQSYLDAVQEKAAEANMSAPLTAMNLAAQQVTDGSSGPDSDWNSDKKTSESSLSDSEDNNNNNNNKRNGTMDRKGDLISANPRDPAIVSLGPPRKRHKASIMHLGISKNTDQ